MLKAIGKRLETMRMASSFVFRLFSTNKELLSAIASQLANRGFSCSVRLKERAGSRVSTIALNRDYWLVKIAKRSDVAKLAAKLLRYSLHPEKVERMNSSCNIMRFKIGAP